MSSQPATPVKDRVDTTESTYYRGTSTEAHALHTDPDCTALDGVASVREVSRAQYPAAEICSWCRGDASKRAESSTLAHQLRQADSLAELREGER